ncbi:MAG TPA: HNH endonuclease signature motif containing protein [Candidatus Thermoplasmatota archaeon]|nr:HNH endonuclease signature motif containing protein [Candidatus Thermoplasmatota archaeon]
MEPDISKEQRLSMAAFFDNRCAYCEGALGGRWHADHLVPVDVGGFNHISNRVAACPKCNEHEKRDMDWRRFVEIKSAAQQEILASRLDRIENWVALHEPVTPPVTEEQRAAWRREVETVARVIDDAWNRLKNGG